MSRRPAILFVCTGNICRSPLAEAAFRAAATRCGLDAVVDSAGTGDWHTGEPPDRRAQEVARRNGIDIAGYRARMVTAEDFRVFTHIVALDHTHLKVLRARRPSDGIAELSLLLDHVAGRVGQSVADPYYGQARDFHTTWADVQAGTEALVARLIRSR
ncbi:protein tyrosine phosphatase [Gluconacetobacter diazotrophicus PA1 5]|uniref:protein-tyrosine-phosphatase n=1 Tax=Gluconacetobacter diazotrophicus (strain ATCC 49037 / DSM 5601 / CCUG 37298 / CIP 103539 / LMG 7603 / PAl5) TaxID=272568 RepID=A9H8C8_GLUDA|nr:low molecular weight protein-tyrosine-phosphatase [Gluconacetobacter diazotrophicus]ACI51206.1 protein tyrosine phosphatase [Gluconacetobacter diazotrophicus PA1 5]TWB09762.1 protein-tyrosine phosphatase [Gluconacetobacter diazotrophicus]CAP54516.1 putative low molecular weight phosphotyrosine protein phosphatase [Gluconacetobacter diazotrophicus PA1 5]